MLQLVANAGVGGLESVVGSLAAGMVSRGHAVHVALYAGAGAPRAPLADTLEAAGVQLHPIVLGARAYGRERRATLELCRAIGADVVHTHGYRADIVDAPAAREAGIATVTTVHGFAGGDLKNRIYEALQVRSFKKFSAVAAVSRPLAAMLVRRGVPEARVHTVVNAFRPSSPPLERAAARAALRLPADGFRVAFVGRLSHEKGADVLVDAIAAMPEPRPLVSVLGDGREHAALEARARARGIAQHFTWHGAVPHAGALLRAFDVLVLSSRTEGTPMVLFEAMAAGVPIIASEVGGVPDVVDRATALLVSPENPAALALVIAAVRADPAAAQARADAAARRLTTHFAPEPWLDRYEAIYRGVAGARSA